MRAFIILITLATFAALTTTTAGQPADPATTPPSDEVQCDCECPMSDEEARADLLDSIMDRKEDIMSLFEQLKNLKNSAGENVCKAKDLKKIKNRIGCSFDDKMEKEFKALKKEAKKSGDAATLKKAKEMRPGAVLADCAKSVKLIKHILENADDDKVCRKFPTKEQRTAMIKEMKKQQKEESTEAPGESGMALGSK